MNALLFILLLFAVPVICNCQDKNTSFTWSKPVKDLQLGIKTDGTIISLQLKNSGNTAITVYSHVAAMGRQYDWFSFRIYSKDAVINNTDTTYIPVTLMDRREKSAVIYKTLAPGGHIIHTINLLDWLGRKVNTERKLKGDFQIQAVYKNDPCADCSEPYKSIWTGEIETPAVPININKVESVKLKITVTHFLPVGWGNKYMGKIEKVLEGNPENIGDTIQFGITAQREYEFLKTGDTRIITFENSGRINDKPYLPPINGTVSKTKEIWQIIKIEKAD